MYFDIAIFVAGDKAVPIGVQYGSSDFLRLGQLVLVDLHQVLPHIEFRHSACSSIEDINDLLALIAQNNVHFLFHFGFHDHGLPTKTIWK